MMKPLLMATLCHRGRLFTETIGGLQSAMSILFWLVTNSLLNRKGQPIIQVGLLWIPHSIEAGLFVSNVCSVAMLFFLNCFSWNGFALWGSFWPDCEHWRFHSMYRIVTFFCSVHVRLLHCKMRDMFWCGKLCTLVLSLCDFTFYSCKGDDDIKIQRRHIKQGNNELKRQFATTDRLAAGTEATELFSTEFSPKRGTYKHKMEWQKLIDVVIGLTYGFVHAIAVVILTFASVKWQEGK